MARIHLCGDICSPSWSKFHLCCRCIEQQSDELIDLCDDVELSAEDWIYGDVDDDEYVEHFDND